MRVEIKSLTPKLAAKLLKKNKRNRPLSMSLVKKFAAAIKDGSWLLTHQGVAVARDGSLLDGQHRCHAVVLAKRSIRCPIWSGCDPKTFDVIDQGVVRSTSDLYVLMGGHCKQPRKAVSIAASMIRGIASHGFTRSTRHEIAAYAVEHEALISDFFDLCEPDVAYSSPVVAAFAKAALEHGADSVRPLVARYAEQRWTDKDPLRMLRDFVISKRNHEQGQHTQPWEIYGHAVRAVRSALNGESLIWRHARADTKDFAVASA